MSTFLLSYFPTFPAFSLEVSKNTHGAMHMELKELLGREVDLVVEGTLRPYAAENANRDKKLIYNTAVNDIPILKKQAESYINETNWSAWEK